MDTLDKYLEKLRKVKLDVPDFSSNDGGTGAKVLFLLQDPGKSGAVKSGVVDRGNKDATAENFTKANDNASLHRKLTVSWNTIPWAIPDDSTFAKELEKVRDEKWLDKLLEALPKLEVVVLLGNEAHRVTRDFHRINEDLHVLHGPHPSQRGLLKPGNRLWLDSAVRKASDLVSGK